MQILQWCLFECLSEGLHAFCKRTCVLPSPVGHRVSNTQVLSQSIQSIEVGLLVIPLFRLLDTARGQTIQWVFSDLVEPIQNTPVTEPAVN